jgi:hypothetical protein
MNTLNSHFLKFMYHFSKMMKNHKLYKLSFPCILRSFLFLTLFFHSFLILVCKRLLTSSKKVGFKPTGWPLEVTEQPSSEPLALVIRLFGYTQTSIYRVVKSPMWPNKVVRPLWMANLRCPKRVVWLSQK